LIADRDRPDCGMRRLIADRDQPDRGLPNGDRKTLVRRVLPLFYYKLPGL